MRKSIVPPTSRPYPARCRLLWGRCRGHAASLVAHGVRGLCYGFCGALGSALAWHLIFLAAT